MKNTSKKLISMLLVFAMVLSIAPAISLAANAAEIERPQGISVVQDFNLYNPFKSDAVDEEGNVTRMGWYSSIYTKLPATVKVDGADAAVTWAEDFEKYVDLSVLGYYALPGTVVVGEETLTTSVTIQVRPVVNLLADFDPSFEDSKANYGYKSPWTNNYAGTAGYMTPVTSPVLDGSYSRQHNYTKTTTGNVSLIKLSDAFDYDGDGDKDNLQNVLAAKVNESGSGQYSFSIWGCLNADAKEEHRLIPSATWTLEDGTKLEKDYHSQDLMAGDKWVNSVGVYTVPEGAVLSNVYLYAGAMFNSGANGDQVYLDNFELVKIDIEPLTEEPDVIASVEAKLPALGVQVGYPNYVPNWEAGLDLPTEAKATLENGNEVDVVIVWDYSELDLNKAGKYVVSGKIATAEAANFNNLTVEQVILVREQKNLLVNGDFKDRLSSTAATGWTFNFTRNVMKNPEDAEDYLVRFTRGSATENSTLMSPATDTGVPALKEAITKLGAGEYYLQFDAKSVPLGEEGAEDYVPAYNDISVWAQFYKYSAEAGKNQVFKTTTSTTLTTEWQTIGYQYDVTEVGIDYLFYLRVAMPTAPAYFFVDNMKFFKLVETLADPAACEHASYEQYIIAPTCTEDGYTMNVCSACGYSYNDAAVDALGHTAGDAVIENEKAATCGIAGSYESVIYCSVCKVELSRETLPGDPATGEHTYEDGKCTECGAEEPVVGPILDTNLSLALKALVLDSYIGAQFIVNPKVTGYDNIYITVSADGAEPIAYTETIDSRYYAYTHGVAPKNMNVEMEIIVYGEKDGKLYAGVPETWSVKGGIIEMLDKYYKDRNSDVKMMQRCVLLVDMLYYGAAAQTRFGATAHGLATDDLNPDYAALRTVVDAELTVDNTTVSNEGDQLALYSLGLEDQVDLQFIFKLAVKDQSLYTIKVTYGDKVKVYGPEDFAETSSSYAAVVFSELGANAMRDTVSVALFKGETQVSETYVASIAGTAKALIEKGGVNVALAKAMMIYGDSAAAFLAK